MRFLLREQPYEKPLAAGKLIYERDGRPLGRIESWRLSHALDGYRFLRADVDERESSGRTFLFHVLINPIGQVENLRYRYFEAGSRAQGQILRDGQTITNTCEVNGVRFEEETVAADDSLVWYPTLSGLILLAIKPQTTTGLTVNIAAVENQTAEHWFKLKRQTLLISQANKVWQVNIQQSRETWTITWDHESGKIDHAAAPAGEIGRVMRSMSYGV